MQGAPYSGNEGSSIGFDASASSDPGDDIVLYEWDWDNNGTYDATGVTASHSFSNGGSYTVVLRVTDADSASSTSTAIVTVNAGPTAIISGPTTVNEGGSITLDGSNSTDDTAVTGYAWDLDNEGQYDDATSVSVSPSFPDSGSATIGLQVTDAGGLTGATSVVITVNNVAPTANAGGPYSGNEGSSISFDASGSSDPGNDIVQYEWDWDNDGSYDATGVTAAYSFLDSGSHTVGLRVSDADGAFDSATATVTVANVAPIAVAGGPYSGVALLPTTLAGSAIDPGNDVIEYAWDTDNNGSFETIGQAPSVTFNTAGTRTLSLRVTDADGATDSTSTDDALVPSQTLLGPLADSAEIAAAAALGYVVVADLASISEADALAAGASVFYPSPTSMSNTLTSGAPFALFDNPGHPLGGHLYQNAIIVAPTGSMYAPTDLASIDEFMAFRHFLPPFGVDSWNEIVAAAQANDLSSLTYESTATTRSMLHNSIRYGTRHTNISTYAGAGALANWKFYTGNTHIGLDPAATYYFNPALSLDPAASHIQAVPADFALASQSNAGFTKLVLSGNGDLDFVVAAGDSAFIDANPANTGIHAIAGTVTVRLVTDSDTLIHGPVTSDVLIGRFPSAGAINLVGDGSGSIHINGVLHSVSGPFNIDLRAYSNSNVLVEFAGSFTSRSFILTNAPPVADIGGPYSTTEGAGVTLSAANSFNATSYLWDTDNDGNYDNGSGASIVFSTNIDGSYPIGLRIENGGQFDTASTTVEVANVAPVADIGGPYISAPGVTATLDASGSSDPGSDIASYEWDTDGDGNFDNGTGVTLAYTPIATGSHSIYLRVTDDDGASSVDSTTFFASNDVEFTAIINLDVDGNDLQRTSGSGWNASAISVGELNEDGYMEFTATIAGRAMVGLSQGDANPHFSGIDYAFYKNINRIELYERGVQKGSYGTFENGDKFRITINRGDVIYTHNGNEIRRIIGAVPVEGFSFNADVAIDPTGTYVQDVVLAIPAPETPRITHYEGFDPDNLDTAYGAGDTVSITFHQKTDMGGYAQDQPLTKAQVDELFSFNPAPGDDYSGYWSHPAIFVVSITDPAATAPQFGSATVQVAGTQPIYNSKVPLLATDDTGLLSGHWGSIVVLWTNPVNVLVDGNKLTRPSSAGEGWNGGAASSRTFEGDGYMESIVTATGKNRMIGFSEADINQHFSSLNYAIFLHASGTAEAYELGVQRGNLGRYAPGDTIRLERDGSQIIYSVNGLPRRSTTVDPALGLKVDCSLSAGGATFDNTILVLPDSVITASRATPTESIRDAFTLHLDAGWNLIGIPLVLDDPTLAFLEGQTAVAGRAYWVFAARPTAHILTGLRTPQPPIPGDGLYAPVADSAIPEGHSAWIFTEGLWRQVRADSALEAGRGYLLHVE
jgi:PKD repeat protein